MTKPPESPTFAVGERVAVSGSDVNLASWVRNRFIGRTGVVTGVDFSTLYVEVRFDQWGLFPEEDASVSPNLLVRVLPLMDPGASHE